MINLIVTDLDNTLLNDKKEISGYAADILRSCQERGIRLVFATARPERATQEPQRLIKPDYVISNNGATISKNGKIIYNNTIEASIRDNLISKLIELKDITCITAEAGDCLFTNYTGEAWDNENWNLVYNDFNSPLNRDISKISIESKNIGLINEILSEYSDLHLYHNSGEDWSQITYRDSTKINAINYILSSLNLHIENVVAFGDDFNDIDMIKSCGIGVAVNNAIDMVKHVADHVCLSNNDDGVAKWLQEYLL